MDEGKEEDEWRRGVKQTADGSAKKRAKMWGIGRRENGKEEDEWPREM